MLTSYIFDRELKLRRYLQFTLLFTQDFLFSKYISQRSREKFLTDPEPRLHRYLKSDHKCSLVFRIAEFMRILPSLRYGKYVLRVVVKISPAVRIEH